MPILLPCEDEIVENTTSFHSVSYHRIMQNAVVTSVVIATGKAMHSWSECGDWHDMDSVGAGVGGGRTTENHNERFRRPAFCAKGRVTLVPKVA